MIGKDEQVAKKLVKIGDFTRDFLSYNFGLSRKFPVTFEADRDLYRRRMYSNLEYHKPQFVIVLDYKMLLGEVDDKDEHDKWALALRSAYREALRMVNVLNKKGYKDTDDDFKELIKKFGLRDYGGLPQMGLTLYTYTCSVCHNIQYLSKRKLPKSKDVSLIHDGHWYLTPCCHDHYLDKGFIYYNNAELQRMYKLLQRKFPSKLEG